MDYSLDWLLYPLTSEQFYTDYFEKKYLHIARENQSTYYSALLNQDKIDQILGGRLFRFPALRLTKFGQEVNSSQYTNDKFVDMSLVYKHFLDGFTIILNAMHEQDPDLGALVGKLSQITGHPFQTNVYITPPNSQGFPAHYDSHDVFILQVAGSKTWRIYKENPIELPTKLLEFQSEVHKPSESLEEVHLSEGDLLYIPRGYMHDATTSESLSAHVTLGWLGFTWTDLMVQMILDFSKTNPSARRFLPNVKSINPAETVVYFKDLIEKFSETVDLENAMNQFRQQLNSNLNFNIPNILKNTLGYHSLDLSTPLIKRKDLIFDLSIKANEVVMSWSSKEINFPEFTYNTLKFIHHLATPFSGKDLPEDLDDEGKLVLLKRLMKEGVIRLA